MTDDHLTDAEWLLKTIKETKSIERLESLGEDIKYDTWEKVEYTQDPSSMEQIRAAWGKRMQELKSL